MSLIATAFALSLFAAAPAAELEAPQPPVTFEGWINFSGEEFQLVERQNQYVAGRERPCVSGALPRNVQYASLDTNGQRVRITGRAVAWAPDEVVEVLDREQCVVPLFSRTPFYRVMKTGCSLVIGTGEENGDWQDIDVFAGRQLAQMIIAPLGKGDGPVSVVAFGTARAGGFLPSQCQVIDRLLPALRNAWELQALRLEDLSLIGD